MARNKNPWSDLDEYAEAMLKAEAEKRGLTLADLGVLSQHRMSPCTCTAKKKKPCGRINHFERYSLDAMRDDLRKRDEDNDAE